MEVIRKLDRKIIESLGNVIAEASEQNKEMENTILLDIFDLFDVLDKRFEEYMRN